METQTTARASAGIPNAYDVLNDEIATLREQKKELACALRLIKNSLYAADQEDVRAAMRDIAEKVLAKAGAL